MVAGVQEQVLRERDRQGQRMNTNTSKNQVEMLTSSDLALEVTRPHFPLHSMGQSSHQTDPDPRGGPETHLSTGPMSITLPGGPVGWDKCMGVAIFGKYHVPCCMGEGGGADARTES